MRVCNNLRARSQLYAPDGRHQYRVRWGDPISRQTYLSQRIHLLTRYGEMRQSYYTRVYSIHPNVKVSMMAIAIENSYLTAWILQRYRDDPELLRTQLRDLQWFRYTGHIPGSRWPVCHCVACQGLFILKRLTTPSERSHIAVQPVYIDSVLNAQP